MMPQARYDGRESFVTVLKACQAGRGSGSAHGRYVQADMDTPYPRTKAGGMSASWTRYDGEEALDVDGRYSVGHRMREGRV